MAYESCAETTPSNATKPAGGRCMFPATQLSTTGSLPNTKNLMPGTVGGGAGAGTYRLVTPGASNTNSTDYGEKNTTTITENGWVLTSGESGALMPLSSIAAGDWVVRFAFGAVTYTGTFQFGVRFWQISADKATKTLLTMPGANANGWVYSATLTPSATDPTLTAKTLSGVNLQTFAGGTPYLWMEWTLKIVTIGAATATVTMHTASVNVLVPAISYSRTSGSTGSASTAGTRKNVISRASASTAGASTQASRVAALRRTSTTSAPVTGTAAARKVANSRTSTSTAPSATAGTRQNRLSRAGSTAAPVTGTTGTRTAALLRGGSTTAGVSGTSAARQVVSARSSSSSAPASTSATRQNLLGRSSATSAPVTGTAGTRVQNLQRRSQTELSTGGGETTIIGRPTTLRRLGGLVSLNPGQVVPVEPAWYDTDGNLVSPAGAVVSFRNFSTGSARYWTGEAWTSTPTTLPTTAGRYVLTVPSEWLGLVVAVTASLTGQPDLTDTYTIDEATASRASAAALTAVQADTDDLQTALADVVADLTTILARVDVTVSSRSSGASVAAVQASTDALQLDTASLLARLSAARALLLDELNPALADPIARESDVNVTLPETFGAHAEVSG